MANGARLFREVCRLAEGTLRTRGMRKHKHGIYTRQIKEDINGIVGFNAATKYGLRINPIIGVRHEPLERWVAELQESEFIPYNGDTIASPIGYLMDPPEYRTWSFEACKDNAATVADMVDKITTVGFRYMEKNTTLEAMCERVARDRHFIMGSNVYQLPVAYMMLGRFDEAEEVVRDELAKIAAHKPPTVEELEAAWGEKVIPREIEELEKNRDKPISYSYGVAYRRFAERFFRKLDEERSRSSTQ